MISKKQKKNLEKTLERLERNITDGDIKKYFNGDITTGSIQDLPIYQLALEADNNEPKEFCSQVETLVRGYISEQVLANDKSQIIMHPGPFRIYNEKIPEISQVDLPYVFETADTEDFNRNLQLYLGPNEGRVLYPRLQKDDKTQELFIEIFNTFGAMRAIRKYDFLNLMLTYYDVKEYTAGHYFPTKRVSCETYKYKNRDHELITLTGNFNHDDYEYKG